MPFTRTVVASLATIVMSPFFLIAGTLHAVCASCWRIVVRVADYAYEKAFDFGLRVIAAGAADPGDPKAPGETDPQPAAALSRFKSYALRLARPAPLKYAGQWLSCPSA